MKIELKNVKHCEFASQETNCFEATVYIDGKRAGTAYNEGHGGPTSIDPQALRERLDAHAKTLPPVVTNIADHADPSKMFTYERDGESLVDEALTDWLITRDLKRALSKRVVFVRDGEVRQTKSVKANVLGLWLGPQLDKTVATLRTTHAQVLNLLPFDQALALYRQVG